MERQVDVVSTTVTQTNQINPVNAAGFLPPSPCNGMNPYGVPVPPPFPYLPPFVTAPINVNRGPEIINESATINPVTIPANSSVTLSFGNGSGCGGCDRGCGSCNSCNRGHDSCGCNRGCGSCNSCRPCRRSCPPFNRCPRPDRATVTLNLTLAGTSATGQSTVIITAGDRLVQTIVLVGTESRTINTTFEVFSFDLPIITVQNSGNMAVQVLGGSITLRGIHFRNEGILNNGFSNFNNFGPFGGFNNFNNGFFV